MNQPNQNIAEAGMVRIGSKVYTPICTYIQFVKILFLIFTLCRPTFYLVTNF